MKFEIKREQQTVQSDYLKREVIIDFYMPPFAKNPNNCQLLLINDGQDLITMDFKNILETLYAKNKIVPLFCAGIHCGADRKNEYGTARMPNAKGEGAKAAMYSRFVMEELLNFTRKKFAIDSFSEKSFCGFSLGGLSALDIVWNHANEFSKAGVFSGSLWWRSVEQGDPQFDENKHRIIHNEIRDGGYYPWLQFFFETGILDETADRNYNGIIDSIDDTLALIAELKKKGYPEKNIRYLELADGRHNVATWARAFPEFLKWGWGIKQ
jgi:enterochelin esterase-like enzyme